MGSCKDEVYNACCMMGWKSWHLQLVTIFGRDGGGEGSQRAGYHHSGSQLLAQQAACILHNKPQARHAFGACVLVAAVDGVRDPFQRLSAYDAIVVFHDKFDNCTVYFALVSLGPDPYDVA